MSRRPTLLALVVTLAAAGALSGCRSRGGPVPTGSAPAFTAPVPAAFDLPATVVLYGDSRRRLPVEVWRETADAQRHEIPRRIAEERPDLVVHSGDLVSVGDDPREWAVFDDDASPIRAAGTPFLPVAGNHEHVGDEAVAARLFDERFPRLLGGRWHEVRVGPLVLLLVDTNGSDLPADAVAAQDAWYAERLAAADADPAARFVVVVGHHPAFTNAVLEAPSRFVRAHFVDPGLLHPKVAAFVSGHVHGYERFVVAGRQFVVSGGGGAPRITVRDGLRLRDEFRGGPIRPFNYLKLVVERDRVVVDVLMLDDVTAAWYRGDGFVLGP